MHQWLSNLGFAHYERQIRGMLLIPLCPIDDPDFQKEHKIQGDSLCLVDTEGLKNIGVSSMGQRLSILKGIYEVKIAHNVEFGEDDYIPPCKSILVRYQESQQTTYLHQLKRQKRHPLSIYIPMLWTKVRPNVQCSLVLADWIDYSTTSTRSRRK